MIKGPWIFKHDVDGVLRDFHGYAFNLFFNELYPEYKQYLLPKGQNTGWNLASFLNLNPTDDLFKEIDTAMDDVFFYNEKHSTDIFLNAKALVTEDEWVYHYEKLKKDYDCRIVISTHQYFPLQQKLTIDWLANGGIIYDDIIMTGHKQYFGGHFLLDDKPDTIENFHDPNNMKIGVFFYRSETTKYYLEKKGELKFPMVESLTEYREVINHFIK